MIEMIIILIILLILILLILLLIILNNKLFNFEKFHIIETFENSSNTSNYIGISPVIKIAEEFDKLKVLEKINNDIENKNEELRNQINSKGVQLNNLDEETKKKKEEKLEIEQEISNLNKSKEVQTSIAKTLVKSMNTIEEKEMELKRKEAEIQKEIRELRELKDKPIPEIPPVKLNQQQLDLILEKLMLIEKLFKETKEKQETIDKEKKHKDICQLYSSMPIPTSQDFIKDDKKDLSYLWCLCNDNLNKNVDCMEYNNCLKNYTNNKDKNTIEEEDLTLYFRCINKFPEFPKFLKENQETK